MNRRGHKKMYASFFLFPPIRHTEYQNNSTHTQYCMSCIVSISLPFSYQLDTISVFPLPSPSPSFWLSTNRPLMQKHIFCNLSHPSIHPSLTIQSILSHHMVPSRLPCFWVISISISIYFATPHPFP